jgi:hypothetical protein
MSFLFKSKKQRERDSRKERRRAFRQAENAVDEVKERIARLDKEATKQWDQAREAMKGGEREKARRLLQGYRSSQVLATKMEQKRWVFEQYLLKMENAKTDQEFASSLAAVNRVTTIDPELVENVFAEAGDLLEEQAEADQFWKQLYNEERGQAQRGLEGQLPDLDALERQIEEEAALESGQGSAQSDQALKDRLGQARERIGKILGD